MTRTDKAGSWRTRRLHRPEDTDRGSVSAMVLVMAFAMLVLVGLTLDVGQALAARDDAATTAQQAARAGADALQPESLRDGSPTLDGEAAAAAARAVLDADGVSGEININGPSVTVRVTVSRRTVVLGMVGLSQLSGTAEATAFPLSGTTTEG